jgi:hypothetical protein
LVAKYEEGHPVGVGARFTVQVKATGEVKGAVQAISIVDATRTVYLDCVKKSAPGFWEGLEDRLEVDPTPPAGIALGQYQFEQIKWELEPDVPGTERHQVQSNENGDNGA